MGKEGAGAADFQTMLRRVQETDYHTSAVEQREVENAGWDIHFPPVTDLWNWQTPRLTRSNIN